MELTLGSLVNEALGGWRRVPPATTAGRCSTMEPAWFGRAKKSADRMAAVRRSIAEVADCANPGLPSLHGRLGSVGALFHDAVRLRAARHGAALVQAQPGVTGIGIARALVLGIGVRIVERAIAGFAHDRLGCCRCRYHRQ